MPALDTSLPGYELRIRGYGKPIMAAASNRMMLKSVAQASHDAVLEEAVIATDNAGAGTEQNPTTCVRTFRKRLSLPRAC